MNLILLEAGEVDASGMARLTGRRAAHVIDVLKAVAGQEVRIGLVDGPIGRGAVAGLEQGTVTLQCLLSQAPPPPPPVDLLLAVPRPKVLRRLWAQLAALGVGRIMLTNAERVERHYFDTHVLDAATYRPLLIEGLEQARDTRLPLVSVHRRFRPLIEDELDQLSSATHRLVASPASDRRLSEALATHPARVLLAVGPEGGWNRFELDLLGAHGFVDIGMGPRTLRSDTATVALLALVHEALRAAG